MQSRPESIARTAKAQDGLVGALITVVYAAVALGLDLDLFLLFVLLLMLGYVIHVLFC